MKGDVIPFERLCIGMKVVDEDGDVGRVFNLDEIHNVIVEYDESWGTGISCYDKDCEFYSPLYWYKDKSNMKNKKVKEKEYVVCDRCEDNNWDKPKFWGCPRGSCDAEVRGTIKITKELKLDK
jgi:hypothetical protein